MHQSKGWPGKFHHEQLYRGSEALQRLGEMPVTVCGAGALGSHLAENLVRQGFRTLRIIDHDWVEEHNISTQVYGEMDIGGRKAEVLRNRLFRSTGVEVEALPRELNERTVRSLLREPGLVVDTFDNSVSRRRVQQHCRQHAFTCVHVGLFADYCEVVWDEDYRVPEDGGLDVCDYPLARNLVLLAVVVASETLIRFVLEKEKSNWSATLGDLAVRPLLLPRQDRE